MVMLLLLTKQLH